MNAKQLEVDEIETGSSVVCSEILFAQSVDVTTYSKRADSRCASNRSSSTGPSCDAKCSGA